MLKIANKITVLIIFLSLFVFGVQRARAANVSFGAPSSANMGESLNVMINAETDGVLINSTELVISYDNNLMTFTGYSDDNSVIKLWIDPPHTVENDPGKIYLSGIIPGGVLGLYDAKKEGLGAIPLVRLFFTAKKEGNANFYFIDSKILEHDGKGTALAHDQETANVAIKNNPNGKTTNVAGQENIKENVPQKEVRNPVNETKPNDLVFWMMIFVLISGVFGYKLLKYKG